MASHFFFYTQGKWHMREKLRSTSDGCFGRACAALTSEDRLQELRVKYLGKKGELTRDEGARHAFPPRNALLSARWSTESRDELEAKIRSSCAADHANTSKAEKLASDENGLM